MHRFHSRICRAMLWSAALAASLPATAVRAQIPDFGGLGDFGGLAGLGPGSEAVITAKFTAATEGRPALLWVTAQIAAGFHVFAIDQGKLADGGGPQPTEIALAADAAARVTGPWVATQPPQSHVDTEVWKGLEIREHTGRATWVAPVAWAPGIDPAQLVLKGRFTGQACNPNTCIPLRLPFEARLGVADALSEEVLAQVTAPPAAEGAASPQGGSRSAEASTAPGGGASTAPGGGAAGGQSAWDRRPTSGGETSSAATGTKYDLERIELSESGSKSLAYFLVTAFLGGVLLNVMPCVLPVIGLKIMSFVQQAGESRAHAWALNIWYSAGIVAVFWGLAGLAAAFGMGWGTQNANDSFNLVLIGIVFAMALSLIGVWEIPIPGFVGSGAALELAEREGRSAAFLKGVLTTLLATPCTGPFMATALAWAVRQSAWVTFSVFTALGLGMAAPYLLIGAFPELIRFLPKPGMWMETFKKIMGLILMATVVWLLSFLDPPLLVPAAAFLVALTGICGWMARTPATAPLGQRAASWATAVLATLIAAQLCYGMLYPRVMRPRYEQRLEAHARARLAEELSALTAQMREVPGPAELDALIRRLESDLAAGADAPWQPFSLEQLGKLTLQDRRTVLVDFTADWCATCKSLEKLVLKTADVERALASADVATMVADYTEAPDWLTETLGALDSNGVPVIAIFPAHQPYRPIVFRGGYTKSALLEAIAAATGQQAVSRRPSAAR